LRRRGGSGGALSVYSVVDQLK